MKKCFPLYKTRHFLPFTFFFSPFLFNLMWIIQCVQRVCFVVVMGLAPNFETVNLICVFFLPFHYYYYFLIVFILFILFSRNIKFMICVYKLSISQKFNKIHVKTIKQYVYAKSTVFKM
jgi:hypothetical protein